MTFIARTAMLIVEHYLSMSSRWSLLCGSLVLVLAIVGTGCSSRAPSHNGPGQCDEARLAGFLALQSIVLESNLSGVRVFAEQGIDKCGRQLLLEALEQRVADTDSDEMRLRKMVLVNYVEHLDYMNALLDDMEHWHEEDKGCDDPLGYGVVAQVRYVKKYGNMLAGEEGSIEGLEDDKDAIIQRAFWFGMLVLLHDDRQYYRAKTIAAIMESLFPFQPMLVDDFYLGLKARGVYQKVNSMAMVCWRVDDKVRQKLDLRTTAAFLSEAILVAELGDEAPDRDILDEITPALIANWKYLPKSRRDRFLDQCKDNDLVEKLTRASKGM